MPLINSLRIVNFNNEKTLIQVTANNTQDNSFQANILSGTFKGDSDCKFKEDSISYKYTTTAILKTFGFEVDEIELIGDSVTKLTNNVSHNLIIKCFTLGDSVIVLFNFESGVYKFNQNQHIVLQNIYNELTYSIKGELKEIIDESMKRIDNEKENYIDEKYENVDFLDSLISFIYRKNLVSANKIIKIVEDNLLHL